MKFIHGLGLGMCCMGLIIAGIGLASKDNSEATFFLIWAGIGFGLYAIGGMFT